MNRPSLSSLAGKLFKWEFWHYGVFYIPVYFYWFYLSLKAGSFRFFTLVNPGMRFGGFVDYSKFDILEKIPLRIRPHSIFFEHVTEVQEVEQAMFGAGLSYPVILKPDVGERGFLVEKIKSQEELIAYLTRRDTQFILQEYVDAPLELGILYYRYPSKAQGHISSIVKKDFLHVKGDGKATLEELLRRCERCTKHLPELRERYAQELNQILPEGKTKILVEIGNHCRGTTFRNATILINSALEKVFDQVSKEIDGFYFGRFDLRTPSYQDLLNGNFKVMELNGANSEPAHIYDPNYKLWRAYHDLFRHWRIIFEISRENHQRGYAYGSFKEIWQQVWKHLAQKRAEKATKEVASTLDH